MCQGCGACLEIPPEVAGGTCPFCASAHLLPQSGASGETPQGVWPFALDERAARQAFGAWIQGLWFRPTDLGKVSQVVTLQGVYVPYFLFSAHVRSSYTGERGDLSYERRHDAQGKVQTVQRISWRYVSGTRRDVYEHLLVCASRGLPRELADRFATFDVSQAYAYREEFLLGWVTERPTVSVAQGNDIARERMETQQRSRCAANIGGSLQRNVIVHNKFSGEALRTLLLPVYVCNYRYRNREFRFFVNAQSGEVMGNAPLSWAKILSVAACILSIFVWFFVYTDEGKRILRGSWDDPGVIRSIY